ncbi:hypothetical protein LINPERHAP1_LOCUS26790 [Linum perenne]
MGWRLSALESCEIEIGKLLFSTPTRRGIALQISLRAWDMGILLDATRFL